MIPYEEVRRIVNGRSYDTTKSDPIAQDRYYRDNDDYTGYVKEILYRNKNGAFFLLEILDKIDYCDDDVKIIPMSRNQVDEWWSETTNASLFDESFFAVEEAEAVEAIRTVTFTLRIPETLRDKLQKAAADQGVSMNTYLLQCSQQCLKSA